MTVQNACLIFILCFSGITGWLMLREPASISVAGTHGAQTVKKESGKASPSATQPDQDQVVRDKLSALIIPVMDFKETTIEEAMDFLRLRAYELAPEDAPVNRGVSFIIRKPMVDSESDLAGNAPSEKLINLYAEDISITDALDLICEKAECRWEITADSAIRIISLEE